MARLRYLTAHGTAPPDQVIESGSPLSAEHLPSLTSDDYSFMGWLYKDGVMAKIGDIITRGLTLTAKWESKTDNKIESKSLFDRIIYTDENRQEVDILQEFEIDVDVANQKDFQIKMYAGSNEGLKTGCFWFIQDEEYGGIIDEVKGNSANSEITFIGRNARGILASKVVEPLPQKAISGTISDVFNNIIESCDLLDLFVADKMGNEQYIVNHQLVSYKDLYTVLNGIAKSVNCTMSFAYKSIDNRWHITLDRVQDYSDYLNYCQDNSIKFETDVVVNAPNHIICINEAGYVIHLFTDENGGLMPYTFKDNPLEDSDYILDKRNQVIYGTKEYTKLVEVSNAVDDGYKKVDSMPKDWKDTYKNYLYLEKTYNQTQDQFIVANKNYYLRRGTINNYRYEIVDNPIQSDLPFYFELSENYKEYEMTDTEEAYRHIAEPPDDWDLFSKTNDVNVDIGKQYYEEFDSEFFPVENPVTNDIENYYEYTGQFSSYFRRITHREWDDYEERYDVSYEYESIEGIFAIDRYYPLQNMPTDWYENCIKYFVKVGVDEYENVEYENAIYYDLLSVQPDDWDVNFHSYFVLSDGQYINVPPVMEKGEQTHPSFRQNKYYARYETTQAPVFEKDKYYWADVRVHAPEWESEIYEKYNTGTLPVYQPDNTFVKTLDHYASLVEAGINELNNSKASQKQEVKLDEFEVKIGDIVGGEDILTGFLITEPVTNIIAKLNKQGISIEYTIGGGEQ